MKQFQSLIIASVILFASPVSWACSYDGQFSNPFSESYPGSLDVAIATQEAIRSNSISLPPKLQSTQGLRRVTWWLNLMAKMQLELPEGAYVYLVDSQLWSQLQPNHQITVHVPPPQDQSNVIQLTEITLHNLINKQISYEEAKHLGIILES